MTRVLVISQLPPPIHGSTVMTRVFLATLEELGYEWRLVDRRFSTSVSQVGKFNLRKAGSAAWMPFRLIGMMWRFRPTTVVVFATNRVFSFLVDWILSEVLRCFRVRRINYLHTVGFTPLASRSRVLSWMVGRLLRSAHTTVHLGEALTPDVARWVPKDRIAHIPNTVADQPTDLEHRPPNRPPLVLYLSNLIPEKGADTFVDLAIELAPEIPQAEFVVAGAAADHAFVDGLRAKVAAAGLSSRVRFPGAIVDQREKWRLMRDAAVLVFPSMYEFEAFPLVVIEALACGTPVATYRTGAIAPVVDRASAGIVVDVGDRSGLLRGVRALLADADDREAMSRMARALYEREYTPERFRQRWAALLSAQDGQA